MEKDDLLKRFGFVISQIRMANGESQLEFLNRTGIHIGRLEMGKTNPSLYEFVLLCDYLERDSKQVLEEILNGEETITNS